MRRNSERNKISLTLPSLRTAAKEKGFYNEFLSSYKLGTSFEGVKLVMLPGENICFKAVSRDDTTKNFLDGATFSIDLRNRNVSVENISRDEEKAKVTARFLAYMVIDLVNHEEYNKKIKFTAKGNIRHLDDMEEAINNTLNTGGFKLEKGKDRVEDDEEENDATASTHTYIKFSQKLLKCIKDTLGEEGEDYTLKSENSKHIYTFKDDNAKEIAGNMTIEPTDGKITISDANNEALLEKMVKVMLALHAENPDCKIVVRAKTPELEDKVAEALKAKLLGDAKDLVRTSHGIKAENDIKREENPDRGAGIGSYASSG